MQPGRAGSVSRGFGHGPGGAAAGLLPIAATGRVPAGARLSPIHPYCIWHKCRFACTLKPGGDELASRSMPDRVPLSGTGSSHPHARRGMGRHREPALSPLGVFVCARSRSSARCEAPRDRGALARPSQLSCCSSSRPWQCAGRHRQRRRGRSRRSYLEWSTARRSRWSTARGLDPSPAPFGTDYTVLVNGSTRTVVGVSFRRPEGQAHPQPRP